MQIILGTEVYDKVVGICGKSQVLNDVKKLSSEVQTSHLEAFHSTLNQFHPKMTAYSYTGTYCRYNSFSICLKYFSWNKFCMFLGIYWQLLTSMRTSKEKQKKQKMAKFITAYIIQNTKMVKN